jgi:CheY-like chemotaxis protein
MKRKQPEFRFKRAMLLDDSELDNYINEKIIESAHFAEKVYVSTSGKSALEFLKNISVAAGEINTIYPEVIFVDVNMPFMDGFEFIQHLRKINYPNLKFCRIVILTSSIDEGDKIKAKEIDQNILFFSKPLTEDMLRQM